MDISIDKRFKPFQLCVLLLRCYDFNCGSRRVFSQSQHEFEPDVSEFARDWTNRVGAASMFASAVVVDLNSLTNEP